MGYLVQQTRAAQLLIGGVDYTSSLIEFSVADSSAYKSGLIVTTGTLTLGQRPGQADIQDYDRNTFKRGVVVTLDITEPGGAAYRHPRGYLYVVGVSYNVEAETLEVELGCQLALGYLTDNADAVLPLVPIPLDPAQQTIENCSASFASAGMVLYQDNTGALQSRKFFGTDSSAGIEAGVWVSVLGDSTLAVTPQAGTSPIPDEILLSYQVPEGALADDQSGRVDTTTETSRYFLNYPATVFVRNPNPTPTGERRLPDTVTQTPPTPATIGSCGQVLSPPTPGGTEVTPGGTENYLLCSDEWTTDRTNKYLPATRISTQITYYDGPGGQQSYQTQTVQGPEIEANPGYFADKYAYCMSTYSGSCNPSGSCPFYGMSSTTLSKQTTRNIYGDANELVRTIQDTFATVLSAYTPAEWRSGIVNGVPQNFNNNLSSTQLYRQQRIVTDYYKDGNTNVQKTTTYTSLTSRGVGPLSGKSIDALQGIKTVTQRVSTTTATLNIRPDTVNSATTSTEEKTTTLLLDTDSYTSPPSEAGKYILEESIPVPLLSTDAAEVNGWVADYSEYIKRFVKGDTYGLQIAESMRSEIVTGWYPGQPFRYADTANGRIMAMRADACTWGVTPDEALIVMNGVWNGYSSGTLVSGSNLVGNSTPDMEGNSPTPPPGADPAPSISNDVIGETLAFIVDVNLYLDSSVFTYTEDGIRQPNPTDLNGLIEGAIVPYCTGFVVATGDLLDAEGNGSIPAEYNGSLVVSGATVVTADLFAAA